MLDRFRELTSTALPLPAAGDTAGRWRALAAVATEDLALAKLVDDDDFALEVWTSADTTVAEQDQR